MLRVSCSYGQALLAVVILYSVMWVESERKTLEKEEADELASFSPVVGNACFRVLAKSSIAVVLVLGSASFSGATAKFDNMNGEYLTSPTPKAPQGKTFNTKWDEYPGGDVEYFEVYMGPITSLYSEVWWANVPSVQLPPDLIKRFDGKGMAVVGYETDSVRKTPGGDVSVPINMAYNHHHDAYFTGKHSRMEKVPYDPADLTVPLMARAHPNLRDMPVETSPSPNDLPTSLHLADGNGGEYRKSYHGFPAPVAYVVDSPQSVSVNPMFIDTWNRDKMNISGGSKFVPGPMPKHSEAPPDAPYSGLLECPLTDRIAKIFPDGNNGWSPAYNPTLFQCDSTNINVSKSCAHTIANASACFAAAKEAVNGGGGGGAAVVRTSTGASDTVAAGCTLTHTAGSPENATATYDAFFNTNADSKACCGAGVSAVEGTAASLVELGVQVHGNTATITLVGPASVWFGVGFFAQAMQEAPYAIIIEGGAGGAGGTVNERVLASHMGSVPNPGGTLLKPSVTVVENSVVGGKRTVVVTRPSLGLTKQHANFTLQDTVIPFINAIGAGPAFGYHADKTAASLSLWPAATPSAAAATAVSRSVCLCEVPPAPFGGATGSIKYVPTGEEFGFINGCSPEPRESILASKNPACDLRAYVGGLQVCKHKWSLLDADQKQPWPDQPLEYYQKYRFYYQPYEPARHVIVNPRSVWAIGAFIGEYDVPQCTPGTAVKDCTHEIWGVVKVSTSNKGPPLHIAAAHFHCHAPTCLAMEIWNNVTGELVCRQRPVFGGSGKIAEHKFDEPGYIAQPPCLWGSEDQNLAPMPLASGETFTIKAITNSTYGHHGEMAFPEIALVPWNTTTNSATIGHANKAMVRTQWTLLSFNGNQV